MAFYGHDQVSTQTWEYRERHYSRNLSSASRRDMLRAYLLLIFCRLISKQRRGARALFLNLSVGLDLGGLGAARWSLHFHLAYPRSGLSAVIWRDFAQAVLIS